MAPTMPRVVTGKMPTSAARSDGKGARFPSRALLSLCAGRSSGFTLIELLVVLSISAVLIAIVPLAVERFYESAEYRGTVRQMLAEIAAARRVSAEEGRAVAFYVDLGGRKYGIEGGQIRSVPAGLAVRATVAGAELSSDGTARIRFFPDGGTTGGAVELLRASGAGVRLRADWLLGQVSQERIAQ